MKEEFCFDHAFRYLSDPPPKDPSDPRNMYEPSQFRIIHGLMIASNGKQFTHAWVEVLIDGVIYVYGPTLKVGPIWQPTYYGVHGVKDDSVVKYTADEAYQLACEHEDTGRLLSQGAQPMNQRLRVYFEKQDGKVIDCGIFNRKSQARKITRCRWSELIFSQVWPDNRQRNKRPTRKHEEN